MELAHPVTTKDSLQDSGQVCLRRRDPKANL